MQTQDKSTDAGGPRAVEHVTAAHGLLKALQEKIGEHPEIGQAIPNLALAVLAVVL